jgi:hypothetical protein
MSGQEVKIRYELFELQKLHFEVKGKHSITKDEPLGQADINVDEYVLQKKQDITVKLSDGGSLLVKRVVPISFRLYARYVLRNCLK